MAVPGLARLSAQKAAEVTAAEHREGAGIDTQLRSHAVS